MPPRRWISCIFFAGAFVELLREGSGTLVVPGAASALAGVIFSLLGREAPAALTGTLTASASFAAQAVFGFCESCTAAAVLFSLGGLSSGADLFAREGKKAQKVAAAVAVALLFLSAFFLFARLELTGMPGGTAGNSAWENREPVSTGKKITRVEKALLYFSPFCRACGEAVRAAVSADPGGKRWEPVVVPELAVRTGEEKLKEAGYSGKVRTSSSSPAGKVPCLVLPDGRMFVGAREVAGLFENLEKE
ncbi:hypothetical protein G7K71_13980 [Desulfofundulus sp. TPOSR]|uniref:hypothetical protein n=1 Tax=Desulfofundulus sp. TPOSR TaxID=2714340 RepID=UPI0014084CA2|nr:hypothetical protein [Desulfofundulus sp. TPOSR]NHM28067.1 hypothetical protein [Desulfofundulus sp. TPOSR]